MTYAGQALGLRRPPRPPDGREFTVRITAYPELDIPFRLERDCG
jgi:hypothetical protein